MKVDGIIGTPPFSIFIRWDEAACASSEAPLQADSARIVSTDEE